MYEEYQSQLAALVRAQPDADATSLARQLSAQTAGLFGDRVKSVVTGGAPTSPAVCKLPSCVFFVHRCL